MRRRTWACLLISVAIMLPWSIKQIVRPVFNDFGVYLTAARLVREGAGKAIYDGADTGQDPQQKCAAPGSAFALAANRQGIPVVMFYLYPPALADLMVPFTYLPLRAACALWMTLSLAALAATAALLAWFVRWKILSWRTLLLFCALVLCRPVEWCLLLGQVTVFLLLLWTAGIVFYARGWVRASAVCLGLAAAIKLTPLFVIVPLLLWREWRWTRWFAATLAACVAAMLVINGPATLADFFGHVLPSMANGVVEISNLSVVAGTQMLYVGLHGGDPWYPHIPPHWVALLGKVLGAIALIAFSLAVARGRTRTTSNRVMLLSLAALLSTCVAPVAWRHAYTVAFLVLFFLWRRALESPLPTWKLALLVLFTLELNFVLDSLLVHGTHGLALSVVPLLLPALSIAVALVWAWPVAQPASIARQ